MGFWISKLESLPHIYDWYYFLVGNYNNNSFINNLFRDDFSIIAERIGTNTAIISHNKSLECELQQCLKNIANGELGKVLCNLEQERPGLLIINRHPLDLSRYTTESNILSYDLSFCNLKTWNTHFRGIPNNYIFSEYSTIIYVPFSIIEKTYSNSNELIDNLVSFSRNENDVFIQRITQFDYSDNIYNRTESGVIIINYNRSNGNHSSDHFSNNSIKNIHCPSCFVQIDLEKSKNIQVSGNNYLEVLEVSNQLMKNYSSFINSEENQRMENVLVICALEKELEPLLDSIDIPFPESRKVDILNGRKYYLLSISKELRIICTTFRGMGQVNAAVAILEALREYNISKIILTGICGGMDHSMKYGDIIISDQIVDYELAKIETEGETTRWSVYRSDYQFVQDLLSFKDTNWWEQLKISFPEKATEKPSVFSGIVLSGNKVVADEAFVDRLKSTWKKAIAIEMEASGIAAALHMTSNSASFVMVKSICDFANANKTDDWQDYAASVSAYYVLNYVFSLSDRTIKKESKSIYSLNEFDNKELIDRISKQYSMAELNVLAYQIGIDFEEIYGSTKSEKIVELIKYCERKGLISTLIHQIS